MERAGSCDYGQLDTEGGSAGKATRKSRSPKDSVGDAMDTKHLRCFHSGSGASYGFFPPTRIPAGSHNFLTFVSFPSQTHFGGKHSNSLLKPSFGKLEMEKLWLPTNLPPSLHLGCRRMNSQWSLLSLRKAFPSFHPDYQCSPA